MLGGGAVVLQHLGDGALVDALEVQLPLPKFQETPENRRASKPTSLSWPGPEEDGGLLE